MDSIEPLVFFSLSSFCSHWSKNMSESSYSTWRHRSWPATAKYTRIASHPTCFTIAVCNICHASLCWPHFSLTKGPWYVIKHWCTHLCHNNVEKQRFSVECSWPSIFRPYGISQSAVYLIVHLLHKTQWGHLVDYYSTRSCQLHWDMVNCSCRWQLRIKLI